MGLRPLSKEEYEKVPVADLETLKKNAPTKAISKVLPLKLVLSTPMVGNQASQGSCVAWASGYCCYSIMLNSKFNDWTIATRSPSYIFNQLTHCTQEVGCGNGCGLTVPDALTLIKEQGVCSWKNMPYVEYDCFTQPNATQISDAAQNKALNFGRLANKNDIAEIKSKLNYGYPIIISIPIYDSFFSMWNKKTGVWDNNTGQSEYSHAVCIIGYDDNKTDGKSTGMVKVQNSWGTDGGDMGFFWIPYTFIQSGCLEEAYVLYSSTVGNNNSNCTNTAPILDKVLRNGTNVEYFFRSNYTGSSKITLEYSIDGKTWKSNYSSTGNSPRTWSNVPDTFGMQYRIIESIAGCSQYASNVIRHGFPYFVTSSRTGTTISCIVSNQVNSTITLQYSTDEGKTWNQATTASTSSPYIFENIPDQKPIGLRIVENSLTQGITKSNTRIEANCNIAPILERVERNNTNVSYFWNNNGISNNTIRLEYSTNGGSIWVSKPGTAISPRTLSSVPNVKPISYKVVSCTYGCEVKSNIIDQKPPYLNSVTRDGTSVSFNYNSNGNPTITLQYSDDQGSNWKSQTGCTSTSPCVFYNVPDKKPIVYRVLGDAPGCATAISNQIIIPNCTPATLTNIVRSGTSVTYHWINNTTYGQIKFQYSTDGGNNWISETISTGTQTSPRQFSNIPDVKPIQYRIITFPFACGEDGVISNVIEHKPCAAPNLGTVIRNGTSVNYYFGSNNNTITLQYSTNQGSTWVSKSGCTTSPCTYVNVPNIKPITFRIVGDAPGCATSASNTIIHADCYPTLTLEKVERSGTSAKYYWNTYGAVYQTIGFQYSTDGGASWKSYHIGATSPYSINGVPSTLPMKYRIIGYAYGCNKDGLISNVIEHRSAGTYQALEFASTDISDIQDLNSVYWARYLPDGILKAYHTNDVKVLRLYNINGNLLIEMNVANQTESEINIDNLPSGVYILTFDGFHSRKVLKDK
ncbi:MAG: T9SS type A sorting domain-containing protein [Bacteroidota bacterium]|nr:MAG: T9SS type A sorting domain-containing protein [Bacteroidota bacterium]